MDKNIEILKTKKHFNQCEWSVVKQKVKMTDLQERLKNYRQIHLDGIPQVNDNNQPLIVNNLANPLAGIGLLNRKISE